MTSQAEAVRHNPGASQRAAEALLADPERGNLAIASAAGCSAWTVWAERRRLERLGQIPPRAASPGLRPGQQLPSRTRDAIAAGARTPRQVADAAQVSLQAAYKALKNRSTGLADLAAAADAISVQATVPCKRCGTVITFDPRRGPRRACSNRCSLAIGRELRQQQQATGESPNRWPPVTGLPPAPDFSQGLCTTVKPAQRRYWTSSDPGEREAAAHMCAGCPVREPCADWSLALPASDPSVYAGLSQSERVRRRRAWLLAIAAQVRNPRS